MAASLRFLLLLAALLLLVAVAVHGAAPPADDDELAAVDADADVDADGDAAAAAAAAGDDADGGGDADADADAEADPSDIDIDMTVLHAPEEECTADDKTMAGDTLTVFYKGELLDGTVFDQTEPDKPASLQLGQNRVIYGMEMGLLGMCPGEVRRIVIPWQLGFGDKEQGPVPAKSTVVFEVELVSFDKAPAGGRGGLFSKKIGELSYDMPLMIFMLVVVIGLTAYAASINAKKAPTRRKGPTPTTKKRIREAALKASGGKVE